MKKRKMFIEESRLPEVKMFLQSKGISWSSNPLYVDGGTVSLMVMAAAFAALIVSLF